MYTFALTLCALLALFGAAAIICEKVLDPLIFEPIEEDLEQYGLE